MRGVFVKCSQRHKDGKGHRSWSVVESRSDGGGKVAPRHVRYREESNDSQQCAWEKTISLFDETQGPRASARGAERQALPAVPAGSCRTIRNFSATCASRWSDRLDVGHGMRA
jgi:hypothetical protein